MIYGFLTRTEFAEHAGIAKPTVTKAVKQQRLVVDAKTDKLDPSHPVNLRYLHNVVSKGIGSGISKDMAESLSNNFAEPDRLTKEERRKKIEEESIVPGTRMAHARDLFRMMSGGVPSDAEADGDDKVIDMRQFLAPGDQLKMAQTTLANIRIAKELDDLIVRDMYDRFIGRLSGIMTNRLLCLGQRMAKPLCDVFGKRDPELEIKVQQLVEEEVEGAVEAVQREITDATDW